MACETTSRQINTTSQVKTFISHSRVIRFSDWLRQCYDLNVDTFGPEDESHRWQLQLHTKIIRGGKRCINLIARCSKSQMALIDVYAINAKQEEVCLTSSGGTFRRFVARKAQVLCDDVYEPLKMNGTVTLPKDQLDIRCQISELELLQEVIQQQPVDRPDDIKLD
jgi:hypothetical protein